MTIGILHMEHLYFDPMIYDLSINNFPDRYLYYFYLNIKKNEIDFQHFNDSLPHLHNCFI